jgi:hypothetical protein
MSLKLAEAAVNHLLTSTRLPEAVAIARGQIPPPKRLRESGTPGHSQTQRYFLPNEDAANRAVQYLQNFLGAAATLEPFDGEGRSGYVLTVSGSYSDDDITSAISSLGGFERLDVPPGG